MPKEKNQGLSDETAEKKADLEKQNEMLEKEIADHLSELKKLGASPAAIEKIESIQKYNAELKHELKNAQHEVKTLRASGRKGVNNFSWKEKLKNTKG